MYNRYACHCDNYRRLELHEPSAAKQGCEVPPPPPRPLQGKNKDTNNPLSFLNFKGGDGSNPLSFLNLKNLSFLPKDMDFGDMLLFAVLILLYLENNDEECLIMLLVLLFMK